jgi:hypothetical protein
MSHRPIHLVTLAALALLVLGACKPGPGGASDGGSNGGDDGGTLDGGTDGGADGGTVVEVAPTIVRPPGTVQTHSGGTAVLFVVATGGNLTYEWQSLESGTTIKSGPEPFLVRPGHSDADDGDCYRVRVSNSKGSVTTEDACKEVDVLTYDFNADDGPVEADGDLAAAYGNSVLALIGNLVPGVVGLTIPGTVFPFGTTLTKQQSCGYAGGFLGATLDGVPVTTDTALPLGEHQLSFAWEECRDSPDETIGRDGALLVTYDFPQTLGVGTFTVAMSGFIGPSRPFDGAYRMNGVVTVTTTRSMVGADTVDDIDLVPRDDLSIWAFGGLFRKSSPATPKLTVKRTVGPSGFASMTSQTRIGDFPMATYDVQGLAATTFNGDTGTLMTSFPAAGSGQVKVSAQATGSPSSVLMGELTFNGGQLQPVP